MPVSCRSAIAPAATPPTRVTSAAPSSSPTATSPPCAMASRTIATPWECATTSISCPRSSWSSPRPISPIGSSAATTKRSCNTPFASDRPLPETRDVHSLSEAPRGGAAHRRVRAGARRRPVRDLQRARVLEPRRRTRPVPRRKAVRRSGQARPGRQRRGADDVPRQGATDEPRQVFDHLDEEVLPRRAESAAGRGQRCRGARHGQAHSRRLQLRDHAGRSGRGRGLEAVKWPHGSTHRHRRLFGGRCGALLSHRVPGGRAVPRRARAPRGLDAHALLRRVHALHRQRGLAGGWGADAGPAHKLARAGADFLICPDNTIHQALPWVVRRSPLPWLHIAEEVAAQAAERGFHRLGIIGTRYLVDSEVYPEKLTARSIGYLRPNTAERAEVNRIIFEELVAGVFRPEAMASIQR